MDDRETLTQNANFYLERVRHAARMCDEKNAAISAQLLLDTVYVHAVPTKGTASLTCYVAPLESTHIPFNVVDKEDNPILLEDRMDYLGRYYMEPQVLGDGRLQYEIILPRGIKRRGSKERKPYGITFLHYQRPNFVFPELGVFLDVGSNEESLLYFSLDELMRLEFCDRRGHMRETVRNGLEFRRQSTITTLPQGHLHR